MTSRLPYSLRPFLLPLFALAAACEGTVDPPAPVPVSELDLRVDAPDTVQAGDSFDISVTVGNPESRPTYPLTVVWCLDEVGFATCGDPSGTQIVGELAADDSVILANRGTFEPVFAPVGRTGQVVGCVRESEEPQVAEVFCLPVHVYVRPDVAELCDPPTVSLPLSDNTATYECDDATEPVRAFAVDAEPGYAYVFETNDGASWHFDVFTAEGTEILDVGSTANGKFFVVDEPGLYYIVVRPGGDFDFTLVANAQ